MRTRFKEGKNEGSEEMKENGGGRGYGLPISWAGRKKALGLTTPAQTKAEKGNTSSGSTATTKLLLYGDRATCREPTKRQSTKKSGT